MRYRRRRSCHDITFDIHPPPLMLLPIVTLRIFVLRGLLSLGQVGEARDQLATLFTMAPKKSPKGGAATVVVAMAGECLELVTMMYLVEDKLVPEGDEPTKGRGKGGKKGGGGRKSGKRDGRRRKTGKGAMAVEDAGGARGDAMEIDIDPDRTAQASSASTYAEGESFPNRFARGFARLKPKGECPPAPTSLTRSHPLS